jgi:hypothetical protein
VYRRNQCHQCLTFTLCSQFHFYRLCETLHFSTTASTLDFLIAAAAAQLSKQITYNQANNDTRLEPLKITRWPAGIVSGNMTRCDAFNRVNVKAACKSTANRSCDDGHEK